MLVPLEASFLWARVLVKKWTRSAAAQRARGPCPDVLELAPGQREQVESPVERFGPRRAPGVSKRRRQRHRPRPPPDKCRERSVAAQPVATTARAGHTSRPATPNRHRIANNRRTPGLGRRFLRKQRDGGSRGGSICANRVFAIGTAGCAALRTAAGPERSAVVMSTAPLSLDRRMVCSRAAAPASSDWFAGAATGCAVLVTDALRARG